MKFRKGSNNCIYIKLLSVFFVFLMFLSLSIILILLCTNFYKNVKKQVDSTFNSSALVSYLSNKIKNSDSKENEIKIIKIDGIKNILMIKQKDEKLVTYVYEKNDVVYECVAKDTDKLDCKAGQRIFEAKSIEYKICEDNLIRLVVKTLDGEEIIRYISVLNGGLM